MPTMPPAAATDPYRDAWLRRQADLAVEAERWRTETLQRLVALVPEFAREFGLRRILVFGSLARGDAGPGSDVDLLVEGLDADRFWDACVWIDRRLHPIRVDLVPVERARPEILARALAEGKVLHGA